MTVWRRLGARVTSVVSTDGRVDPLVLTAFVALQLIVLANAIRHPAAMQYDGEGHLQYMATLAEGRLPTWTDTKEYFSPPLPYLVPALLHGAAGLDLASAAKGGQLFNVLVSCALGWFLLALCELARPGARGTKVAALVALALFPVYFRTLAMVRGEPFVALFTLMGAWFAVRFIRAAPDDLVALRRIAIGLGVTLGLGTLSRQWAFFAIPAVTLVILAAAWWRPAQRWRLARALALAGAVTIVVGAWYYADLYRRFGTVTAFNRPPEQLSLRNQPREFYLGTGSGNLFRAPVRPAFPNQLLPIFYADTWGDYWGFFQVRAVDTRSGEWVRPAMLEALRTAGPLPDWVATNRDEVARYLGRVNLVSLLPTLFALTALLVGIRSTWRYLRTGDDPGGSAVAAVVVLVLLCSAAGYFWFVVKYPIPGKGDTIKASYMLHAFPCAALLAGMLAGDLWRRWPRARYALAVAVALVFLHNLPALLTRNG